MVAEPATRPAAVRPRNRRQIILESAGVVFSERGYHAAALEDISDKVGITAPALYRHFPNKYALFVECANLMVDRLVDAVRDADPQSDLDTLLGAVAGITVAHRAWGGMYRWEARYLEAPDREALREKFAFLVERVSRAVPSAPGAQDPLLRAGAALGAIGSITMHHTQVQPRRCADLLVAAATRVASADPSLVASTVVDLPARPSSSARRTQILDAAVDLFAAHGYPQVSLSRIARAVGIGASAIYRHYPGKADILAAACMQANDLLGSAVAKGVAGAPDPDAALTAMASVYVAYSFEHHALTSVAEAEVVGLPDHLRLPVVQAQRAHIATWVTLLGSARPDLDEVGAKVVVHAALGVVVEAGRRLRWQDTPAHRSLVQTLVLRALAPGPDPDRG